MSRLGEPSALATNWGPSAEPPMPATMMFLKAFAFCGLIVPAWTALANFLMLASVPAISLRRSSVGAFEASRSQ